MTAQAQLRQAIEQQQHLLSASIPADRGAAVLALLSILDRLPPASRADLPPDLVTGRRLSSLGANKALKLCLEAAAEATAESISCGTELEEWAARLLQACRELAAAELVLAHSETGFMRLVADDTGQFDAWIATKRPPATWRERADIDWWAAWLAKRHASEFDAVTSERRATASDHPDNDALYRRLADVHLKMMAYQLGYPPEAVIGGCTVQTYRAILAQLIVWALQARDRREALAPQSERSLIDALASALAIDPELIGQAVTAFTFDAENAAYHAAVPGFAAAPLVRLGPDQLIRSAYGLTTEPLFFLARELRRRDSQEYHNTAYLRETVFRQDLYALFPARRFVTSAGRLELRRGDGEARTDVDAVVFDRKTGTLGFFELKSQDPFARSTAELTRQRDNVLYANHQISRILDWLNRHGADELLTRVDAPTAKRFRVHKVYPFVLGRYLAHFSDGPAPDRRAAWGTWPQLLRLVDGQPFRANENNPLASLFTRLTNDTPLSPPIADCLPREIHLGAARLIVHPSYAAYQTSSAAGQ